jgi:hypothetical protein
LNRSHLLSQASTPECFRFRAWIDPQGHFGLTCPPLSFT